MTTDQASKFRQFHLAPNQFAELFPFHLVLDKEMRIVQMGEVIQRMLQPIPLLNSFLEEHFRIDRPKCLVSFEDVRRHTRSLFLLQSRHKDMQLKGQMVYLEASEHLLFIGSPWVTDIADLKKLDLSLNDFPIWDSVSDYLFLLQTKNSALADTRKATAKLTEQRTELQATASRLRTLIESLQIGVLLEDETRRVILANQEFCNQFNIPLAPEALQGIDCRQAAEASKQLFVEPEQFIQHLDEIVSQQTIVLHKEWQLQDGRIFEQDYIPIVVDRKLYGHLWKYSDITLKKQSENILKSSEEQLKLALDAVEEGLWDWNLVTGKVYRSPRWFTMLGYNPEDLENDIKLRNILIHPKDT